MTHSPRSLRTLHVYLTVLASMCLQACAFEYGSLDELTCNEEGERDGQRVCEGGVWVLDDGLDQPEDMTSGLDARPDASPAPDLGEPGDLSITPDMLAPTDMGRSDDMTPPTQDMGSPTDMPAPVDMPDPADMPDPPDMMVEPDMMDPVDMPGPDMSSCPTTLEMRCALLFQEDTGNAGCYDLSSPITTQDGCVIPAGTRCDCAQQNATCTIAPGDDRGSCDIPCVPESDGDYCARVQSQEPSQNICGTNFQVLDNCSQLRPSVTCDFCANDEQCLDDTQPSQCACVPRDRAELCAEANQSCGSVQVDDGCGTLVTVTDCTTCAVDQLCEANPAANSPGQPANICVTPPAQPVSALPMPAGVASDARFGFSLASDGQWLAIGAPDDQVTNTSGNAIRCGAVYLYSLVGGVWTFRDRIVEDGAGICNGNNEEFGHAVAIDDGVLVVGAPGDGATGRIHVYERSNMGVWDNVLTTGISNTSQSRFGHSVAIKRLFNTQDYRIAVGAPDHDTFTGNGALIQNTGTAYNIRRFVDSNGFLQFTISVMPQPRFVSDARAGTSVAFLNEGVFGAGAPDFNDPTDPITGGALYVWSLSTQSGWGSLQGSPFKSSFYTTTGPGFIDEFGKSISYGGSWNIVGAPGRDALAGSVFVADVTFTPRFVGEIQPASLLPTDGFGSAVAAHEDAFLVGAPNKDGSSGLALDTGAVYLYEWDGAAWVERLMTTSPTQAGGALGGTSVELEQDWGFFGAPEEAEGRVYLIERSLIP